VCMLFSANAQLGSLINKAKNAAKSEKKTEENSNSNNNSISTDSGNNSSSNTSSNSNDNQKGSLSQVQDEGITNEIHKANIGKVVFSKSHIEQGKENSASFTNTF